LEQSAKDLGCQAETSWQNLIGAKEMDAATETPERIEKELLGK
jgi:hypothetical protein